jgi:hypothetical protein
LRARSLAWFRVDLPCLALVGRLGWCGGWRRTGSDTGFISLFMNVWAGMPVRGSQIINICAGLGLPWLLSTVIRGKDIFIGGHARLFRASTILLSDVTIFAVLTLGFALWQGAPKVWLHRWKAYVNLGAYGVSLVVFAFFTFYFN